MAAPAIPDADIDVGVIEHEDTDEQTAKPWKVIGLNDDHTLASYVTVVLMRIFSWSQEKAETHMLEIHEQGRSVLEDGNREAMEQRLQQLHAAGIQATIEQED